MGYLPLGEPPRNDVEAAARLLVRYRRESPLTPEGGEMFFMSLTDPDAVIARAEQIEREQQ